MYFIVRHFITTSVILQIETFKVKKIRFELTTSSQTANPAGKLLAI